jgi:hypothetical protein
MKRLTFVLCLGAVLCAWASSASAGVPFVYKDGLAPRDEWGRLHQMPQLDRTDWEHRYAVRFHYYWKSASTLQNDPAYVGAVQRDLRRLGYYCGEIDGVFTPEVSDAVARLQKHYGYKVTGTVNVAVRRALRLP